MLSPLRRISIMLLTLVILSNALVRSQPTSAAPRNAEMLVITSATSSNVYGPYLAEILRAEGWMGFVTSDIGAVTASTLAARPLVLLAEMTLDAPQRALLKTYLNNGGRLIAMRPDAETAPLLGLSADVGTQQAGYLKLDVAQQLGRSLGSAPLQIHGSSKHYNLNGALAVAQLHTSPTVATAYPAVARTAQTAAFAYDLPTNIVLTRQGNPANASYVNPVTNVTGDLDGDCVVRTIDLFQGEATYADNVPNPNYDPAKPTAPENNPVLLNCVGGTRVPVAYTSQPWVDRDLLSVPQADRQMRLLSGLIEQLSPVPLPRLWYHPDGKKTLLVLTGDAHANPLFADNPSTPQYDPDTYYTLLIESVKARGGRFTTYLTKGGGASDSAYGKAKVEAWHAEGQDFGIHPPAKKANNFPAPITNLTEGYNEYVGTDGTHGWWFGTAQQPGQKFNFAPSRTVRTHQVAWQGWTDAAEIEAARGIRLDTNFYTWGNWLRNPDGSWPYGPVNGSGQPMRFVKADGTILPLYQQVTQLIDEQLFQTTPGYGERLSATQGISVSKKLIDASENGDYATLMTQFHIDYFSFGEVRAWAEATMDYAVSKGIPLWSAEQQLQFLEARNAATFQNSSWDSVNNRMTYTLKSGPSTSTANLTLRLEAFNAGRSLKRLLVDGVQQPVTVQLIGGQPTVFVSVAPGTRDITAEYLALDSKITVPAIRR